MCRGEPLEERCCCSRANELGDDESWCVGRSNAGDSRRSSHWAPPSSSRWAAGPNNPVVPGLRRDDWPLPEPKGQAMERVRQIHDDIRDRVWKLLAKEGWWKLRPAQDLCGVAKSGIPDLATDPKHLEGFGSLPRQRERRRNRGAE